MQLSKYSFPSRWSGNSLFPLLRTVSFAQLQNERVKTALTVLGIALGIAIFFAISSATDNAWQSFERSTGLLREDTPFRLVSASGSVPEEVLPKLFALGIFETIRPRSSLFVRAESGEKPLGTVQIIGTDLFAPPEDEAPSGENRADGIRLLQTANAVLLSPTLYRELSDGKISVFYGGGSVPLEVIGAMDDAGLAKVFGGRIVLIDIAGFQELFGSTGRVDSIALSPKRTLSRDQIEQFLAPLLPSGVSLEREGDTERHARKMSEAFQLNLRFLGGISLFVALLLVYNTMSYSALKRKHDLSILRSIGASSNRVFQLLTTESMLLGLAGSILGIFLGYFLSLATVKLVSATFSTLYLPVRVTEVSLQPGLAVFCLLLGPILALAGSAIPARQVSTLSIRETITAQAAETRFRRRIGTMFWLGAILLACVPALSRAELLRINTYLGFAAPTCLLTATVLVTPFILMHTLRLLRPMLERVLGAEALLALDHIQMTIARSSASVSAIVVALGMYVGVTTMILSFRSTVTDWIEQITKADVYISASAAIGAGVQSHIPDPIVDFLRTAPFTEEIDWVQSRRVLYGERLVRATGVRFEPLARHNRVLLKHAMRPEELAALATRRDSVLVSETFAEHTGHKRGDMIEIPGLRSTFRARIANIFYDYSSDQGVVYLPDTVFENLFDERQKEAVSLYLREGSDFEKVRAAIDAKFPDTSLIVRSNRNLREEVLRVFDDTFRVTYALQAIALVISALTIFNTVLMLMLDRSREFAVMRAIGASTFSLARMVMYESLLLGVSAVAGSVVLGLLLAVLLVFVINKFFFGWSVGFIIPVSTIVATAALAVLVSVFAGLIPGMRVAKRTDGTALRWE